MSKLKSLLKHHRDIKENIDKPLSEKEQFLLKLLKLLTTLSPIIVPHIILAVALIIIIVGMLRSMIFCDWEIFQRSGALLVVLSLFLALIDYQCCPVKILENGPNYIL